MFLRGVTVFSGSPTQTHTSSALHTVRRTHKSTYYDNHNKAASSGRGPRCAIEEHSFPVFQLNPQFHAFTFWVKLNFFFSLFFFYKTFLCSPQKRWYMNVHLVIYTGCLLSLHQAAQMTSFPATTHLFLPLFKLGWRHNLTPKQVPSWWRKYQMSCA